MFQTYVRNLTHTGPMSFSSLSKQLCTQSSFPARVVGKVQQQARTQSASNPGPLLMHMTSWRMSRWEPLRYIACSADDVFIHLKIILYYAGSYSFPIIRTKLHTTSVVSPHGAHKSSSCLARDLLWGQDSCVDGSAAAAALLPSQVSLQPAQWGQQENHIINPGPRGLTFSWWGCYSLCHKHKPHLPTPFFYSILVSVSVFIALSTLFHSINSPDNSLLSHSVLLVLILPYWSFQLYISLWKSPSALI